MGGGRLGLAAHMAKTFAGCARLWSHRRASPSTSYSVLAGMRLPDQRRHSAKHLHLAQLPSTYPEERFRRGTMNENLTSLVALARSSLGLRRILRYELPSTERNLAMACPL